MFDMECGAVMSLESEKKFHLALILRMYTYE